MTYQIRDITPEEMRCVVGACPSIYEMQRLTPEEMQCGFGACQEIYSQENTYLIVGKRVSPEEFGLEKKVGKDEVLIQIPKGLLKGISRN